MENVEIRKSLRNIPLATFYLLLLGGAIYLAIYMEFPILVIPITLVLSYFILRATIGEAVVTLTPNTILLHAGIFSLGESHTIMITSLRAVYVNRVIGSSDGDTAREINQCIIFDAFQKIRFIKNDIGTEGMKEYKNRIKTEILAYYDDESIPNWLEYQPDLRRERHL